MGEGDTAHSNKILKSSWEVFIGQLVRIRGRTHPIYSNTATCTDESGTQSALFMCYSR